MKPLFAALVAFLIAVPGVAQDEPGGPAFAGGGGDQVFTRVDTVNPMDQVKTFLKTKANVTLSSDQERTLRPVVETALQQIRDLSERVAAQRGGRGGGGERRGGGRGGDAGTGSI